MERVGDPVVLCRHVAGPELKCRRRLPGGLKVETVPLDSDWRL